MPNPTPTVMIPYHALDNVIVRGTRAQQPAATAVTPGTLYCVIDELFKLERSSGVSWQSYSPAAVDTLRVAYVDVANVFTAGQTIRTPGATELAFEDTTTGTFVRLINYQNSFGPYYNPVGWLSRTDVYGNLISAANIYPGGGSVFFPVAQAANANPNALDDYEEGTFTPIWTGDAGAATGAAYSMQSGHYTKVGNLVTVWANMVLTALGSIPGNPLIGGLPFVSANIASGGYGNGPVFWIFGVAYVIVQTSMLVNDTRGYVVGNTAASGSISAPIANAAVVGNAQFRYWLQYRVP